MQDNYTDTLFAWLQGAAELPGKGPLQMALAIQSLSRQLGRPDDLPVTPAVLQEFAMKGATAKRALVELKLAELIDVFEIRGEDPHVTILGMNPAWWWGRGRH